MAAKRELVHETDWKQRATWSEDGYFQLETGDTGEVVVRLFVTKALLNEAEPTLYRQIINATRFPGVKLVAITPDVHYGYGVPVGCVILTDRAEGAVAMGPVGFDIGCGMMSARSNVSAELATPDRKLEFNRRSCSRVNLGAGGKSVKLGKLSEKEFEELVRGGAEHYVDTLRRRLRPQSRRASSHPGVGRVGHPVGRPRASPSAGSTSSARSAAATTSSSCSAARRPGRSSCRSTPEAAASATGSRRTTSRWRRTSDRRTSPTSTSGTSRPSRSTTANT